MSEIIEVRRFSDSKIQAAIDYALKQVPQDKRGAVVAYADMDGARVAAVAKMGDQWSVIGVLDKEWGKPLSAAAEVRFVW